MVALGHGCLGLVSCRFGLVILSPVAWVGHLVACCLGWSSCCLGHVLLSHGMGALFKAEMSKRI